MNFLQIRMESFQGREGRAEMIPLLEMKQLRLRVMSLAQVHQLMDSGAEMLHPT